jgi:uncharacterized repeat protein (TIGR01451 family)
MNIFTPVRHIKSILIFITSALLMLAVSQMNAQSADLQINKNQVSDDTPDEGQSITFTIEVENNGPNNATGVLILDLLPSGLTVTMSTPAVGTYTPATGIWDIGNLNNGDKYELIIVATINNGTANSTLTSTVSVFASDQTDPLSGNNAISTPIIVNGPDLTVTKTVNPVDPDENEPIVYKIIVKNNGTGPASGVEILDLLPTGVSFTSIKAINAGTYTAGTGIWDIGAIPKGTTYTLELNAQVDAGTNGQTIINTAFVDAMNQTDLNPLDNESSAPLTVLFPDIQLTKEVSNPPYNEGVNVTYTINVKNLGPVKDATGVQIQDILPSLMTYVGHTAGQGTYDTATGIWNVGNVDKGDDFDLVITAFPNIGSSGLDLNNTAILTAIDQNDSETSNNRANVEIQVAKVDLFLLKVVNETKPDTGEIVEFTLTLENLGPGDGTSVVVQDILPDGLSFVAFTTIDAGTPTHNNDTITWTIPSLPVGEKPKLKFTAQVGLDFAAQTIVNFANVLSFDQVDGNRSNNIDSAVLFVNGADLEVVKTVDNVAPNPGDPIVYTIKVYNNGHLDANDVFIQDLLPTGVSYSSSTISQGNAYVPGTGLWDADKISVGDSAILTITATVDTGTTGTFVTNTAFIVSHDQLDSQLENDTSSALIAIGEADLGLMKSVNVSVVGEGDPIVYTITIENYGPDNAPLVTVDDVLPSELTYVSHSGGTYDDAAGIWDVGTLNVTSTATLTINAIVNGNTAGRAITNIATVRSPMLEPGAATNSNVDSAIIQVHGADLALTKSTTATAPIAEGDPIPFVITLTNNGPDDATGITVSDYLPLNLDFVSHVATKGSYNDATGLWTGIDLLNGESAMLTINTTLLAGGGFTNRALITGSSELDSYTDNNSSSVFISGLKTFEEGACIINLGQQPQTYDNTLKAYGLLYDIVKNNGIPVWWAIRPDKTYQNNVNKVDEIDFTVDGVDYISGAFIIEAEFVAAAQQVIDEWTTLYPTLEVNCNQPEFEAPIHEVVTSFPRGVLDEANGDKIQSAFYENAGLETNIIGYNDPPTNEDPVYDLYRPDGTPNNLNACDDVYAMPHADPHSWTDAEIENFYDFIQNGGWVWTACHAVSSLETLVDVPSVPGGAPDMNLLSNDGLILWGDHGDGTLPYSYSTDAAEYASEAASDPFMQFIGNIDEALQSGSEQIYIPFAAGWRPSTTVAIWDPDHPERLGNGAYPTNAAAVVAYGRAFGDPSLGMIVYEASHTVASGSEAENVGAARIYGNFWLQAGVEFRPQITPTNIPDEMVSGDTSLFSVSVVGRTLPLTYEWVSECAGTFLSPNSPTSEFIADTVAEPTDCIIRLYVTDGCGRSNFQASFFTIYPIADLEVNKIATDSVDPGGIINYTITVTNHGPGRADSVVVNDTIPAGTTLVSASPTFGSWTAPKWTIGTLDSGAVVFMNIAVKSDSSLSSGYLTNTATLTSKSADPDSTNNESSDSTFIIPMAVRLNLKVMLQGSLFGTAGGLMRDDLRTTGYIPLLEPYTALSAFTHVGESGGGEMIVDSATVFGVSGPNAIVDWVFVEIRDENDMTNILGTRSGLVQRDGDVVDVDGVSPLLFESTTPANYYVSVRHRNHLGAMTNSAIPLTPSGTLVDFTLMDGPATYHNAEEYDGLEQAVYGGLRALWAGNSKHDMKVKYQGGFNDANAVASDVIFHPSNGAFGFNFDFGFGYWVGDVNMDGKVKYQGGGNDANIILNNVLFYPLNNSFGFNYDFMLEQLP